MKNKEYVMHLLAEINNYVLERHPGHMSLVLDQDDEGLHLEVRDDIFRSSEEIEKMHKALNSTVRPELAEYYGAMGGSDLIGAARLNLLGWQIKKAEVSSSEAGTVINLWLGSERYTGNSSAASKKGYST